MAAPSLAWLAPTLTFSRCSSRPGLVSSTQAPSMLLLGNVVDCTSHATSVRSPSVVTVTWKRHGKINGLGIEPEDFFPKKKNERAHLELELFGRRLAVVDADVAAQRAVVDEAVGLDGRVPGADAALERRVVLLAALLVRAPHLAVDAGHRPAPVCQRQLWLRKNKKKQENRSNLPSSNLGSFRFQS